MRNLNLHVAHTRKSDRLEQLAALAVNEISTEQLDKMKFFLALNDICPSKTKAKHPQTNGICERFPKTIQDELYAIALRKMLSNYQDAA